MFNIEIPAKCILGGEYTVLKKGMAIVCPFTKYRLSLKHLTDPVKTINTISGEGFNALQIIMWRVIEDAMELVGKNPKELMGHFKINCTIPPCSGLGFSAALCVAVARWMVSLSFISQRDVFPVALKLEDFFHLKSSGTDIAGVMAKSIICYSENHTQSELALTWKPRLYISNSGEQSITKNCVERIKELSNEKPEKVTNAEDKMLAATFLVKEALESHNSNRLDLLANGLNLANECYYEWELVSKKLNEHVTLLKQHALACKIIGAGYGGHVLSLWEAEPSSSLPFKLHALNY